MWVMITVLFPLGTGGRIPPCLLLGEQRNPRLQRREGGGRKRGVMLEQGRLEGPQRTDHCLCAGHQAHLAARNQAGKCLSGMCFFRGVRASPPLLLEDQLGLLRESLHQKERKRKEFRQRINRSFSQDTVAVGTGSNEEPHSFCAGVSTTSYITVSTPSHLALQTSLVFVGDLTRKTCRKAWLSWTLLRRG